MEKIEKMYSSDYGMVKVWVVFVISNEIIINFCMNNLGYTSFGLETQIYSLWRKARQLNNKESNWTKLRRKNGDILI